MNNKHLFWIIPLTFIIGLISYSALSYEANKPLKSLIETCLLYENEMDMAVILLKQHCLVDAFKQGDKAGFCYALEGTKPNNFTDGIIQKYYKFKT